MRKNVLRLIRCVAMLFVFFSTADAQQQVRTFRIGLLRSHTESLAAPNNDAFRQSLRSLGCVEGKSILIEYRYADGNPERLAALAEDLVRSKVDVMVVGGNTATHAAKQATSTIPIVVGAAGDLLGPGLFASLAQPGGNITGSTAVSPHVSGKRLELLREIMPNASRVAVLWHPLTLGDSYEVKETESAAPQLGVKVQIVEVRAPNDFQSAYAAVIKQQAKAVIIIQGTFTNTHVIQLTELATRNRLPSMCETARWTNNGCLLSYGFDEAYLWRRSAIFVDKILKGAKPADLPVEQRQSSS